MELLVRVWCTRCVLPPLLYAFRCISPRITQSLPLRHGSNDMWNLPFFYQRWYSARTLKDGTGGRVAGLTSASPAASGTAICCGFSKGEAIPAPSREKAWTGRRTRELLKAMKGFRRPTCCFERNANPVGRSWRALTEQKSRGMCTWDTLLAIAAFCICQSVS